MSLAAWVQATRPWSFPASVSAVLVGASVAAKSLATAAFPWLDFVLVLLGAISIHSAGNLTNTFYDYKSGLDKKKTSDDRTLVDGFLKPSQVFQFAAFWYFIAVLIGVYFVLLRGSKGLTVLFLLGGFLTFSYTATPFKLKYRALGDIVIFLCFGPLMVEGTYVVLTQRWDWLMIAFAVPMGCLTEAILHVNNTRDIEADRASKAYTIAQMLGRTYSLYLYVILFVGAYTCLLWFAYIFNSVWLLLPVLQVPWMLNLFQSFHKREWKDLCPRTGQFGLVFGILFSIGIWFTSM